MRTHLRYQCFRIYRQNHGDFRLRTMHSMYDDTQHEYRSSTVICILKIFGCLDCLSGYLNSLFGV